MFKAREEQLKDLKKLIRVTKKLIPIIKEKNCLERYFLTGLEEYFRIKKDIKSLQRNFPESESGKEKLKEYIKFLKEQVKELEKENPISTEKKKAKRKVELLEDKIKEYVKYISSKSHDFINLDLTIEEFKSCECDELSIFLIILIFKEEIAQIRSKGIAEGVLLDYNCKMYFRRKIFFNENDIRTILTQKINEDSKLNSSPKIWEKREEDILRYPIFEEFDFRSFTKCL